jgi:CIC family chloride channel protein
MNPPISSLFRQSFSKLDERLQLIIVAAVVGIAAGYASVLMNLGLDLGEHLLAPLRIYWYGPLFPACGAALAIFFMQNVIKDPGGHGVPEVIYSISKRGGLIRFRSSFSHIIGCLLTLGSGGSAGPEAPVVISGGSIGSNIASKFYMNERQRIQIVGCGAAAAIAAIFNAPATGIAFALEAVLGEWTAINVVPIAIASVLGTEVSRALEGNQIPFQHRTFLISNLDLAACLGLAVLTAVSSVILLRLMSYINSKSAKWVSPRWLRAALGGALVGGIGLFVPYALGEGYPCIRAVIAGQYPPGIILAGMSVLAKIVATALTLGSGGIGGIFAPCLVVGSLTGIFYQRGLTALLPQLSWAGESYFGLLGMAGVTSSVIQAPMTGIFLIMEITGGYDVLVSVVLVAVLSATLSHFFEPFSVYHVELIERGELLRPRTDARVLSELNVLELLEKDCQVVHPEMTLRDFARIVETCHRNYFPVEDSGDGHFVGLIHLDDIRQYLFDPGLYDAVLVDEIMTRNVVSVSPDADLNDILQKFDETRSWSLPVIEGDRFLGLISKATLLDHYRKELKAQEAE